MTVNIESKSVRLFLSPLPHLWLIDIDGTIVIHNGHLLGQEELLPGVASYWKKIPSADMIVLLTARKEEFRDHTLAWLDQQGLRYDRILFGLPKGERILINDKKESGLDTALSINLERNEGLVGVDVIVDQKL